MRVTRGRTSQSNSIVHTNLYSVTIQLSRTVLASDIFSVSYCEVNLQHQIQKKLLSHREPTSYPFPGLAFVLPVDIQCEQHYDQNNQIASKGFG